jgi:membrane-bound lytic murein transglycosylase D
LTRSSRRRYLEKTKHDYKDILEKLADLKQPIDPALLNDREQYVYNLWAHVTEPNKFKTAKDNIHAQFGLRGLYLTGLQRSGRYLEELKRVFRGYGLPEDLCYLPHVESAYNFRAYSKAGAAGMWQFTSYTGRLYLRINYGIDERYDPFKATDAAARLLKHNYEELGSWPLAVTAYNHGLAGMQRAKAQLQTDDLQTIIDKYDGRAFGFASKNFYAEFMAAVEVAKNFERYFGKIDFEKPDSFHVVQAPDNITLDALAKQLQMDKQAIAQMNPGLRPPIVRSLRRIPKGYSIRVPATVQVDKALLAKVPESDTAEPLIAESSYVVEPGDNLGSIARSAGTTADVLMDLNSIVDPRRLRVGQILMMPGKANDSLRLARTNLKSPQTVQVAVAAATPLPAAAAPVSPGVDSAAALLNKARHHAASSATYGPAPLASSGSSDSFKVSFSEPQDDMIIVQSEETISHLADWLAISVQRLREINNMQPHQNIQVGGKIKVDFSKVSQSAFHRKRLEYHRSMQEGFFASNKVEGTKTYTVKNGDSIWELCNKRFDLPYWLLSKYNPQVDLLRLKPGVEINIPIITSNTEQI